MEGASERSKDVKQKWKKASFHVQKATAFSSCFHTLRDMMPDIYIDPATLTQEHKLGEGAFATVSLATLDGRTVASKCLKSSLLTSDKDLTDFLNEAALLQKLKHASIVDLIGVAIETQSTHNAAKMQRSHSMVDKAANFARKWLLMKKPQKAMQDNELTDDETAAIETETTQKSVEKSTVASSQIRSIMLVQEYMSRGTLKSLLLKQMERPLKLVYTRQEALEWLIQIAQGLKYLHQAQPMIIHRDLKLENLMLTLDMDGRTIAKIGDFGLHAVLKDPKHLYDAANFTDTESLVLSSTASSSSKHERRKLIKASYALSGRTGSFMYMAPEVMRFQPYNEKADVFSFSLIMYELFAKTILLCFAACTGEPDEIQKYAENVARGARPAVPDDWPQDVKDLIRASWAHRPADRPSMNEIVDSLKRLRDSDWTMADQQKHAALCCGFF